MSGDRRRELLGKARLYLVIESRPHGRPVGEVVEPALAGGVDIVQLREKDGVDDEVLEAGRRLRALCDRHDALLIVNDRADLAVACGADGVHLGQEDEPVDAARAVVGEEGLVGLSTHTAEQVDAALASAADYLGVGPVYETATKPGVEPVGEELVRYAAARATKPFFAIGGIGAQSVGQVVAAGATRIAVVRAIRDADDPAAAARELRAALDRDPVDALR
jgi:thiamine-phosphate pyrophosphorylase